MLSVVASKELLAEAPAHDIGIRHRRSHAPTRLRANHLTASTRRSRDGSASPCALRAGAGREPKRSPRARTPSPSEQAHSPHPATAQSAAERSSLARYPRAISTMSFSGRSGKAPRLRVFTHNTGEAWHPSAHSSHRWRCGGNRSPRGTDRPPGSRHGRKADPPSASSFM